MHKTQRWCSLPSRTSMCVCACSGGMCVFRRGANKQTGREVEKEHSPVAEQHKHPKSIASFPKWSNLFKETSICDVSNAQHIANGAAKDQYSNLPFFMLGTHTTVTSPTRYKIHFILTTFVVTVHTVVRSDVGVFVLTFFVLLSFFQIWKRREHHSLGWRKVI